MNDIERAKKLLCENGYTCVLCRGEELYHSSLRGVRPLLDFLESEKEFHGFSAADKTVGAGAAHLYVLLGVASVWAKVMSESARELLLKNGIEARVERIVPYIINRAGNGPCPIESAVRDVSSPNEALQKIKKVLESLSGK